MDISIFQNRDPECSREMIDLACASYFIDDRAEYEEQNKSRQALATEGTIAKAS